MTGIHKNLLEVISGLGFRVEVEYPFPPYQVDCYVPEAHVAFEADGMGHRRKKDEQRDIALLENYGLLVCRYSGAELKTKTSAKMLEDSIIAAIDEHTATADERRRTCQQG